MWSRKQKKHEPDAQPQNATRLRDAIRQAKIETADRTGVIVDLRDAEVVRLDLLNEMLDPLFAEVPERVDLFDRGVTRGEPPRLWIDVVAHVVMHRDKRVYRFVQDSRLGRKVLAESSDATVMVDAVTKYVARRLIERERAIAGEDRLLSQNPVRDSRFHRRSVWRAVKAFFFGLAIGVAAVFAAAWMMAAQSGVQN